MSPGWHRLLSRTARAVQSMRHDQASVRQQEQHARGAQPASPGRRTSATRRGRGGGSYRLPDRLVSVKAQHGRKDSGFIDRRKARDLVDRRRVGHARLRVRPDCVQPPERFVTWLPRSGRMIRTGERCQARWQPGDPDERQSPAYRDLTASDIAGEDILELNRNLVALGFNAHGIIIDDRWQAATTAGVRRPTLARERRPGACARAIVFLPGDQLVSSRCDARLDGRQLGPGQSPSSTNASDPRWRHPPVRQPPEPGGAQAPIRSRAGRRRERQRARLAGADGSRSKD